MHLVQVLLPLFDSEGRPQATTLFRDTEQELVHRFGGITAYRRAPAQGKWQRDDGAVVRDEIVIVEVMVPELDRAWWAQYRIELARRFEQEEIVARATRIEPL